MASKKPKAAEHGNEDARAFIETFEKNAPHPEAMTGRYTFRAGDGFDLPVENVEDGWYAGGNWSIRFAGGQAVEAVRADVEKPEAIRVDDETEKDDKPSRDRPAEHGT